VHTNADTQAIRGVVMMMVAIPDHDRVAMSVFALFDHDNFFVVMVPPSIMMAVIVPDHYGVVCL
jgi:hypothetical protein